MLALLLCACGDDKKGTDADASASTDAVEEVVEPQLTVPFAAPVEGCLADDAELAWTGYYAEASQSYAMNASWTIESATMTGRTLWGYDPEAYAHVRGEVDDDALVWHDRYGRETMVPWYYRGWLPTCGVVAGLASGQASGGSPSFFVLETTDSAHAAEACASDARDNGVTFSDGTTSLTVTSLTDTTLTGTLVGANGTSSYSALQSAPRGAASSASCASTRPARPPSWARRGSCHRRPSRPTRSPTMA